MNKIKKPDEYGKKSNMTMDSKFRREDDLTHEQLTNPDYRLNELISFNNERLCITCSKCHHCR